MSKGIRVKGISLNWVVDTATNTPTLAESDLAALRSSGARMARVDLHLGGHESWSPPLIAAYRSAVHSLEAAGLQVLGLLGSGIVAGASQEKWNTNNAENGGSGWNPFLERYTSAARTVISTFPQISHWEVWNEPNAWTSHTGTVYHGGNYIYPSLYAALLGNLYPLIQSIQPSATVVTGGLFAHDNAGDLSRDNSGTRYLDSVYSLVGSPVPFDVIGMHYYIDQGGALVPEHLQPYLNMLLETISWYEHNPSRPVYITEAGWSTRSVSESVQASNLSAFYEVLNLNRFVQVRLWFQIRDNPGGSQYYGLRHADGTPKPSFAAFQAVPS